MSPSRIPSQQENKLNIQTTTAITNAKWQSADRLREAQQDWMNSFAPHFTHALTLTFDEKHLWRFEAKVNRTRPLDTTELLALRNKSFRYFGIRLSRLLFGNACTRSGEKLLLIGCLEGLRAGERPHYHCALGVPRNRFGVLEQKVRRAWDASPFSGKEICLKDYYSSNWPSYALKNARYLDRESIDWDNARIPASLLAHC